MESSSRRSRSSASPDVEACRAALRPFAAVADFLEGRAKPGDMIFRCVGPKQRTIEIPFSAFQAARAILTPPAATGDTTSSDDSSEAS